MIITVTGPDRTQSEKILSGVKVCAAEQKNTYCYFASSEAAATAHEMGLSYGKYRAFLELRILDPQITPEAIQSMTMREIRDLMDSLLEDRKGQTPSDDHIGHGYHRGGNGYRGRQKIDK